MANPIMKQLFSDGDTILIEGPLRSGQCVTFDGNVVVRGDVKAGAEVVASGHVLVFGALRGMDHGGACVTFANTTAYCGPYHLSSPRVL